MGKQGLCVTLLKEDIQHKIVCDYIKMKALIIVAITSLGFLKE